MRVIDALTSETVFNKPVLTLGTFDGVHLGHQKIIRDLVKTAKDSGRESVLFTFHPHPRMVLYPESHSVRLIDTIEEKLAKLEKIGLDTVILFPFTKEFARLTAVEFVRDILVHQIRVTEMHVGYDHHFGKNREGSFTELVELGELHGFDVREIPAITQDDVAISSTKIRNALINGNTALAAEYLGTPFVLTGTVIHGNKLGRTIGFPTANLEVHQSLKILPAIGVYAVRVYHNGQQLNGVMNIGKKPTVQSSESISVEVFIFDFDAQIYDETITVEIFNRLRGEQRFDSVNSLKEQLGKDAEMARQYLLGLVD